MEFSGVTLPKLAIVTAESCALLNLFWSEAVPQNTFPFALKWLSRPVAPGAGAVGVVVLPGAVVAAPG